MAYIELKDVSYRYPLSKVNALEHVSCVLEKEKCMVLSEKMVVGRQHSVICYAD